jgi:FkbM family methyltransferase
MFSVWTYSIIAAAIGLAVSAAGALLVVRARRAGLALHRQLDELRQQVEGIRSAIGVERDNHNLSAARLQQEVADVRERVHTADIRSDQAQNLLRDETTRLANALQGVSAQVSSLSASVEETALILARRPLQTLPVDPRLLESTSERDLIRAAESLAVLRPLVPYPLWRTDADLNNPDLAYRLRRWLWQYFHDRQREGAVVAGWHADTRMRLFLGNDLSGQIYIAGCIEPNEFAFLDRILQPGMTFLDAGANDGIYTVFAAKRVGPQGMVLAFEPSRRELERLQFNLNLNELTARVFPVALADFNGQAELTVGTSEHGGQNTLGAFAYEGFEVERKDSVEVRRLDDILEENSPRRIDVMKLDVEGSELRLLRGAVGTVERYRPYILFEVSELSLRYQGGSREELVGFLQAQKYRIYCFDRITGLPVPAGSGVYSDNMIGVPEESPLPATVWRAWPAPAAV